MIAIFHLGALVAFFWFHWSSLILFLVMWLLSQNWDRCQLSPATHASRVHHAEVARTCYGVMWRGSIARKPYLSGCCASNAHQYTDRPGDPHSPRDGKWWAHIGWILRGALHNETTLIARYAADLQRENFYRWLAVWHWLSITLTGIALLGGGALGSASAGHRRISCDMVSQLRKPCMGYAAL